MNDLGLSAVNLEQINRLISSFEFVTKAVIFGSRAKGTHKKYSDIDICLFGKLNSFDAERVKSELNDLNIIYEFDVLSYNDIKNSVLREHIDRVGVEIYTSTS